VAFGPTIPLPDVVGWNDDGSLCCICLGARIYVYTVDPPHFTLASTTRLENEDGSRALSAKFLHNVLYVGSRNSVQCILLSNGGYTDNYTVVGRPAADDPGTCPLSPRPAPLALCSPTILGLYHGSLLVSAASGVQSVRLDHPILRMGALYAAGHPARAFRWTETFGACLHDDLARFIERRGYPAEACKLPGISMEVLVDVCIRNRMVEPLESAVELHGLSAIRAVPMGGSGHSAVECVGAFFVSQGRMELTRRLVSECIVSGDGGRREAFTLASLMHSLNPNDAKRLIKRAIGPKNRPSNDDWPVGKYVRNKLL